MGSDLNITKELQEYILSHGFNLHPVQKEIIDYNTSLGDIKRMQISISQSQFLHLIIKISNIKKILEIGTFTGLSTLSMAIDNVLNPVNVPISKIFLIFEIFIIKCRNWLCEIEICILLISPREVL